MSEIAAPIAIVGRGCVLPGALTPGALWEAVRDGRDLVSGAPEGRWGLPRPVAMTDDPDAAGDRTWTDRGGYVTGFDAVWDPTGFAVPAGELAPLDPLFHHVLHGAREALREAGSGPDAATGLVLGNLSFPTHHHARFAEATWLAAAGWPVDGDADPRDRFSSGYPAHLAARALGLGGGAFALDAACASGLYAIALACDRLRDGTADRMVAGGVNRADDLFLHVGFCALSAMSRSGRSRPFHRGADGLIPAEGAAFVALERLDDALAAGRRVYGVIRGVGLSNDGRSAGVLSPSSAGQVRALRSAYAQAGLTPSDIGLVECHATGTPVGDAVELQTLAEVFAGASDVPIGSLKSNLGHLITAAGVAGVLKVLAAMEAGIRPPTLHVDDAVPMPGPLRLLARSEPWTGPRRAAVSAFGFGGNNAHLVVEAPELTPVVAARVADPVDVVIVGLGARVGPGDVPAFTSGPRMETVSVPLDGLRVPPRDLEQTLPQQIAVLDAALDAVWGLGDLPRERTAVLIGMGVDPEIARYGFRWRLASRASDLAAAAGTPVDGAWVAAARDAVERQLEAAGVVGTMPNIPANRINRQLDVAGPSFTVSAEELSGVRALELALRALRAGTIDVAVVGAVDLSVQDVHVAAARAVLGDAPAGDAAVVLVLERRDDAVRRGHTPLALVGPATGEGTAPRTAFHAHAATGLLQVAAAAVASAPSVVSVEAFGGQRAAVAVTPLSPWAPRRTDAPRLRFPAHPEPIVLPPLPAPEARPLPLTAASGTMRPAPPLPDVLDLPEIAPDPSPVPVAAPMPVPVAASVPVMAPAPDGLASVLAGVAAHHRQLAAVHQAHVAQQQALHDQFLALRARSLGALLAFAPSAGAPAVRPATPAPAPAPAPPAPAARPPAPAVVRPAAPVVAPTPAPRAPVAPKPPTPAPPAPPARKAPTGPAHTRADLEVLASGRISDVWGPRFAPQDGYPRQVRMPEPPLLLADRVTGIDAEPLSMRTGTIWTETDVRADSWYVHQGVMPGGIMIESGQADLLLISWLGADMLNQGERIYRLLGCELTWHGALPKVGETLVYDIHVDGHARQGDIRMFFFHYDCHVDGAPRLTVRSGQAGFFTEEELGNSGGVLWDAEDETPEPARVDPPALSTASSFSPAQVSAFAAGDLRTCFGEAFRLAAAHVDTPRTQAGKMQLLREVTAFDPQGGPWGRGYLRAETPVSPDDWFFAGHFKGDPCMPGTLMLEGCLQALAFYLAGNGFTLKCDGWRFEPVPETTYLMRCRGQVIPTSKHLTYEVFVHEVHAGPVPTVFADLLCTVDGLKAFHARRLGLRLVPDWPMGRGMGAELLAAAPDRPAASAGGHTFDYRSLLACAWGRPTEAFGPIYERFDSHRKVARLPGPPYHFMSRITAIAAELGVMKPGGTITCEYDVPPDAWYFRENASPTMPFAVLMEAALQPCGWLASFVGCALTSPNDLMFRNLDGTGTVLREITPDAGILTTRTTLTQVSKTGDMIIVAFDVACSLGADLVYTMKTVFGFFPEASFKDQVGLPPSAADRARFDAPAADVRPIRPRHGVGALALPSEKLLMLDRVTAFDPAGGPAGLGYVRAAKDVDPSEWFFKAHFFQDPVQPGSLGVEALVQLLTWWAIETGLGADLPNARFEPLRTGDPCTWKYRGQVVPTDSVIGSDVEILESGRDDRGAFVVAKGSIWVDGKRIYHLERFGIRVVSGPSRPDEVVLDPAVDTWLDDHAPTFTVPALPFAGMLDRLAAAAQDALGRPVTEAREVVVHRWLPVPGPVRTKTEVVAVDADTVTATLLAWVDRPKRELSRFEPVASGTLSAADIGAPPAAVAALQGEVVSDPYASGALFHGPAFHLLTKLVRGPSGASALVDASAGAVPRGALHPALIDAATHAIPHDGLHAWDADIATDLVAYPHRLVRARFWGPPPTGEVRVEVSYAGKDGRHPTFLIDWIVGDRVWATAELVEVLLPKGPIGRAAPADRRAFLRDRAFVPGLALSRLDGHTARCTPAEVRGSDWLPGTVDAAYALAGEPRHVRVAIQDAVGQRLGVHPSAVSTDLTEARVAALPVTRVPITVVAGDEAVVTAGPEVLDDTVVRRYWRDWFGLGHWPVEDLYYGLIERFVGRVVLEDPAAHAAIRGRSVVYLANHQVMVESLLFSVLAGGLSGVPTVTLAKVEHKTSWLGRLIAHAFTWPGARDPNVIAFFDREDKRSLPGIIGELAAAMTGPGRSVLVHVEGTRSLTCREPVQRISSAFVDLALATGSPIVPVRFTGGLPAEPLAERIEFPFQHGRQDYHLGRPLLPEDLVALPLRERKEVVVGAINRLGVPNDAEQPLPGDDALTARVRAWMDAHGAEPAHAAIGAALRERDDLHPAMQALLARRPVDDPAEQAWVDVLAGWLFPRG